MHWKMSFGPKILFVHEVQVWIVQLMSDFGAKPFKHGQRDILKIGHLKTISLPKLEVP